MVRRKRMDYVALRHYTLLGICGCNGLFIQEKIVVHENRCNVRNSLVTRLHGGILLLKAAIQTPTESGYWCPVPDCYYCNKLLDCEGRLLMGSWRGVNKTRITGRQGSHAIASTVSSGSCSWIDVANLYLNRQSHTTVVGSVVSVMEDEWPDCIEF